MKSPKFRFSLKDLESCLNTDSIKLAWKKKLGAQIRKQIIVDLIEFKDIDQEIDIIAQDICSEISSAQYYPNKPKHYLVEKSRGLCRQMTLAHPRDLIVLQCLSSALYKEIKGSQPTKKAFFEPGDQKFSKDQLLIEEGDYGAIASWKRFQQKIFEFSKERRFIVVTDVANFYDFINFSHMRNIISSLCNIKEPILDFLIFILNEISWNPDFMPRNGIGLPQMELEAPRVLANAMLYELDKVAEEHSFGDYVRFMDDIDVGVDTIHAAKCVVRDIDLALQSRQLRLNSSKTMILRTENGDAQRHFCIKENKFLDYCSKLLSRKRELSIEVAKKALIKSYEIWANRDEKGNIGENSRFFIGNGEKIFKRILKCMKYANLYPRVDDLLWLIKQRPSLRSSCFRELYRTKNANYVFSEILKSFYNETFVDDSVFVEMAIFCIHARFQYSKELILEIKGFIEFLTEKNTTFTIYSAILIASRFLKPGEILKIIETSYNTWRSDYWLSRVVGGLSPRMFGNNQINKKFEAIVRLSGSQDAQAVLDFHIKIRSDVNSVAKIFSYAKSENYTYPQNIYYPKALIILSIYRNKQASHYLSKILSTHKSLSEDDFYKRWAAWS
ncbi:RNA-directed DNA polymerase [Inquilinus sp. NPDC058860]|uniref:RNA-directed DNA polymerase n=1 Tax=Inquilinus sp. NPDC058860 TaxID=3346652 RepID=UPI0036B30E2C